MTTPRASRRGCRSAPCRCAWSWLPPPLASFELRFNAPEYFLLALLGILAIGSLGGSPIKSLAAALIGLMIALIGVDPLTGTPRLSFDQPILMTGIDFIPVVIGVFGIAEVLASLERIESVKPIKPFLAMRFSRFYFILLGQPRFRARMRR